MSEFVSPDIMIKQVQEAYAHRLSQDIKQRKFLFGVSILLLILAIVAIGAIYYLLPLKQTKPVLVILDGTNGIVQDVQYLDAEKKITNNEAVIKSFAYSYVNGRYGYTYLGSSENLREQYEKVMVFTGEKLMQQLKDEISPSNSKSPFSTYGEKGTVKVQVQSISPFSGDKVTINFKTLVQDTPGSQKIYSYTAIGKYEWLPNDQASLKERYLNPFGFKFTEWSVTQNSSNDALDNNSSAKTTTIAPTSTTPQTSMSAEPTPAQIAPIETMPVPAKVTTQGIKK